MEKYYARDLRVVIPSRITGVSSELSDNSFVQTITFEQSSRPMVAVFEGLGPNLNDVLYLLNIELCDGTTIKKNRIIKNATELEQNGVYKSSTNFEYIDVFDGDCTILSDYMFARKMKRSLFNRLRYFEYPLNPENMELVYKLREKLLNEKEYYSVDDLILIDEELKKIETSKLTGWWDFDFLKTPAVQLLDNGFISRTNSDFQDDLLDQGAKAKIIRK